MVVVVVAASAGADTPRWYRPGGTGLIFHRCYEQGPMMREDQCAIEGEGDGDITLLSVHGVDNAPISP